MTTALLVLMAMAATPKTQPVTVFVSAPVSNGFVVASKDIQDSVKDLRGKLKGMKKQVRLVDGPENADIIVTIVARGVGSQSFGQRLVYREYYNNAVLTSVPIVANTFWVTAVMDIGSYRREMTGTYTHQMAYSMGAWSDCAQRLAKEIKSFIESNGDRLRKQSQR